jgi:hypothetical protein
MSDLEREPSANFSQHFLDVLDAVEAYNRRNTYPSLMVRGIARVFRPQEEEYPEVSIIDREDMERDLIIATQADDLMAMGIELVDVKGDETEDGLPTRLVPCIGNTDKFKETLQKLNPTPEQNELVAEKIDWLLHPTVMAIEQAVLREDLTDAEAQLTDFEELVPDLVAKGFDNVWTEILSEYVARSSSGTLADYIGAKARNLLVETGFTIPHWQSTHDPINPEQFEAHWSGAFDYLVALRDRDEPSTFFAELFNKLRAGFDVAEGYIDLQTTHNAQNQCHIPRLKALKAKVIELSQIWEPLFPVENAFYVSHQPKVQE